MNRPRLASLLASFPAVAATFGSRVYPLIMPARVHGDPSGFPCVVYTFVGGRVGYTFCAPDELIASRVQFDVYDRSYTDAVEAAAVLRGALLGYFGTVDGTFYDRIAIEADRDTIEPDPGLYRVTQEYSVWFREG